jgi:hypothetical protein
MTRQEVAEKPILQKIESPSDEEKTAVTHHGVHNLPPDPDAHRSDEERAAIVCSSTFEILTLN